MVGRWLRMGDHYRRVGKSPRVGRGDFRFFGWWGIMRFWAEVNIRGSLLELDDFGDF